ncbi:uncharacterized protein LOC144947479 isoform X1 [Lampetra fluviatilis]
MSSKRSENKRAAELNKRMHSMLGYGQDHWQSLPASTFGKSLAVLEDFRKTFGGNFVASRWMERIIEYVSLSSGTFPASTATASCQTSSATTAPSSATSTALSSSQLSTLSSSESGPRVGGSGGSQQNVPLRQVRERCNRKDTAMARAISILGDDAVRKIRDDWQSMETDRSGSEWQQSERIVLQMLQQGLSERVIRAIIPVGGSRIHRLRKVLENGIETLHTRRPPKVPHHALADDDLDAIKENANTWEIEDDFPCSHRRPRQYFVEPNITWSELYRRYKAKLDAVKGCRVVSYSRWIQYVHMFYPELRLTRTTEDVCDCCVHLDVRLACEDLPADERKRLLEEKNLHLDAAIDQRRTVSTFVKEYVKRHAPDQNIPVTVIPDHYDDAEPDFVDSAHESSHLPTIQIQIEEFGGSFAMPHYGHMRPSADYFDSNLMLQNFVLADITSGINNVIFYDERAQGKDADTLCSLRFVYHMRLLAKNPGAMSKTLVVILDNCVGQNKSQVVFMFFALLSLLFYRKVVLLYLMPGHSHNQADRVVTWCRNSMKGKNFYTPLDIVDTVNLINSIEATFIDHQDAQRPFYTGWESLLKKHFKSMPPRYTSNYFFEVDEGVLSMRHLSSTPDNEVTCVPLIVPENIDLVRRSILQDLFGTNVNTIEEGTFESIRLPTAPVSSLSNKKLASLSKKYFSIPPKHLPYFPAVPIEISSQIDDHPMTEGGPTRATKRKRSAVDAMVEPAAEVGLAAKPKLSKPSLLTDCQGK